VTPLAPKDRKALLEVLGDDAAADEQELLRGLRQGRPWVETPRQVRAMALRKGLLEGDVAAMWAGLKQSVRLDWLVSPTHAATGYTSFYAGSFLAFAGDRVLFEGWLAAQPPRLDDGHAWCVALSNTLTALGRDDEALMAQARRDLLNIPRRASDFEKATAALSRALLDGKPEVAASALQASLEGWGRFTASVTVFSSWYLAVLPIALVSLAHKRLGDRLREPMHPRWVSPAPLTNEPGPGLVDFSPVSTELEAWWRALPPSVPRGPSIVTKVAGDDAQEERRLLEAVAADPDSDAPREVYADWLLERGLGRGDFIRLQLRRARGKLTKEELAREKVLATGISEWLGAREADTGLSGVRDAQFERGFLARCTSTKTTADLRWATVVELRGCVPDAVTKLPALRHLSFRGGAPGFPLKGFDALLLPKLESVVALGTAEWTRPFAPSALDWLWKAVPMQHVKRFACALPAEQVKTFFDAWMPRLEAFTVSTAATRAWNEGHQVRFEAAAGGTTIFVAAQGRGDLELLRRGLSAFGVNFFTRGVVDPKAAPVLHDAVRGLAQSVIVKKVDRVEERT